MKKFKARKRKKVKLFKISICLIIVYIIYQFTFNILFDIKLKSNNEEFIKMLLSDSNHYMIYEKRKNNLLDKFIGYFSSITSEPTTILNSTINQNIKVSSDEVVSDVLTEYIDDPNPIDIDNPKVYIYNTHQLEGYDATNYSDYNITPNVQMASYLLKDKLNNMNIPTIVETGNINDFLSLNGWNYASSYKASRYYLESTLNKYNNLDLIIDLHRDSITHDSSTIEYNGKKYAKILFVVGKDYNTYEKNLELSNRLNNLLKEEVPEISRGVIIKGGNSVNGIYNQDLNNNIVLIECGGNENTIDEIINTVDILSIAIQKYMGE